MAMVKKRSSKLMSKWSLKMAAMLIMLMPMMSSQLFVKTLISRLSNAIINRRLCASPGGKRMTSAPSDKVGDQQRTKLSRHNAFRISPGTWVWGRWKFGFAGIELMTYKLASRHRTMNKMTLISGHRLPNPSTIVRQACGRIRESSAWRTSTTRSDSGSSMK